jgi:hypothetical protein
LKWPNGGAGHQVHPLDHRRTATLRIESDSTAARSRRGHRERGDVGTVEVVEKEFAVRLVR